MIKGETSVIFLKMDQESSGRDNIYNGNQNIKYQGIISTRMADLEGRAPGNLSKDDKRRTSVNGGTCKK